MPSNISDPPPIVIKKVQGHGGHHGGAWKVAYADFVTAMMALFIVLWLMASSEQVKKAVADYFVDPNGKPQHAGTGMAGSGQSMALSKQDLEKIKEELERALRQLPDMKKLKDKVTMNITSDGLRIELLEDAGGVFFASGSAKPTGIGLTIFSALAGELGKLPNKILIEGHTDAAPYQSDTYSNWELSADRANESRKLMQAHGVRADQISQVRGFADQDLRNKANPFDASNRRISVIVQYRATEPVPNQPPVIIKPGGMPALTVPAKGGVDQKPTVDVKTSTATAKSSQPQQSGGPVKK